MTFNYEEKGGASKATRRACYLTIPFLPAANTCNECLCRVFVSTNNKLKICAGSKGQRPRHFLCGQQEQQAALLWRKRLRLNERTDGVINLKRGMPRGTRCSFRERERPRPGKRNASTFVVSLKAGGCFSENTESWLRKSSISKPYETIKLA